MRTYAQAVARAEYLRLHPSADVLAGGHCQGVARDIVGAAGWAPSALDAWNKIPSTHRFSLAGARAGMLGYAAYRDSAGHPKEYGHAFFYVGSGYCYSTDLPVAHRLGKVPLSAITGPGGWNMPLLGFINWTPSGYVGLAPVAPTVHLSHVQAAAKLDPPAYQGHTTYPAEVVLVERTLAKLGYLSTSYVDGSYGTLTLTAYKRFQTAIGAAVRTGIPALADLKVLGGKGGFLVAA